MGKNGTHAHSGVIVVPILKGDLNSDGKVDLTDFLLIKKYLLENASTVDINILDYLMIKKLIL